jgi:F0F1-type ATP synthase membrane subunit c/vacuolar-type H+-ATPase subunit K
MNSQESIPSQKKHKALGLTLVIGPTALFILAFVFAMLAGLASNTPAEGELFAEANPIQQGLNVLVFICAGLGFLTWLPGLIIGIVLLAKKK